MTPKITASDKILSLENHNYRIRHSKDLVRCSFSSLSNSLKMHFSYLFFSIFLRGFIERNFSGNSMTGTVVPVIVQHFSKAHFI